MKQVSIYTHPFRLIWKSDLEEIKWQAYFLDEIRPEMHPTCRSYFVAPYHLNCPINRRPLKRADYHTYCPKALDSTLKR